MLFSAL